MSKKISPSLSSSLISDDSNSIYSATKLKTFKSFVTPIFISYVTIEHNRNIMNPTFNIYSESNSYYLYSWSKPLCLQSEFHQLTLNRSACFYSCPFIIILNKAARVALLKLWLCITLLQCRFIFSKLQMTPRSVVPHYLLTLPLFFLFHPHCTAVTRSSLLCFEQPGMSLPQGHCTCSSASIIFPQISAWTIPSLPICPCTNLTFTRRNTFVAYLPVPFLIH